MPDLIDSTQPLTFDEKRATDAVASFQRLVPRIQPDAALALTLTSWIYGSMSPFVVAAITRALLAAYTAEIERRAADLQATADRLRAQRVAEREGRWSE